MSNLTKYIESAITVIYSLGGPAVIILGLSSFLAKHLSKKDQERLKDELSRAKSQFVRYSEGQYKLYNSLWGVLMQTKTLADSLWEDAKPDKLPGFSEQIRLTRKAVMDNMLLIEESHFTNLDSLITEFEQFKIGKHKLINVYSMKAEDLPDDQAVKRIVLANKKVKDGYTRLIMKVGSSLRDQIKG